MKYCQYCKVNIGGSTDTCPLCQSELSQLSEKTLKETVADKNSLMEISADKNSLMEISADKDIWPEPRALKKQSILYKIQQFIFITIGIICFSLDFFLDLKIDAHWSIIVILWICAFQFFLKKLIRRRVLLPRIITLVVVMVSILMLLSGRFLGFFYLSAGIVVPVLCSLACVTNFIFCMCDRSQNAMVYTLCNILVTACIYLILYILPIRPPVAWTICMIINLISLAGVFTFKGKSMFLEIQKRLFM